jgi:hypothetical protein
LVCFLWCPVQFFFLMVRLLTAIKRFFHSRPWWTPSPEPREILTILHLSRRLSNCVLSCREWKSRVLFKGTLISNHPTTMVPDISELNLSIDSPVVSAICLGIWDTFWIHAGILDSKWS